MDLSGRTAAGRTGGSDAPAAVGLTPGREALVAFEDRDDAGLLRLLRPGFRHCFCLTGAGRRWTLCDPLKSRVALAAVDGADALELAAHLREGGRRRILHGPVAPETAAAWPRARPITCVEIVKRLVGVEAAGVVTPHQLYRRLLRGGPTGGGFVEIGG